MVGLPKIICLCRRQHEAVHVTEHPGVTVVMKPLVLVRTASELTGLSRSKIWELIGTGKLEVIRLGERGPTAPKQVSSSGRTLVKYESLEGLISNS